MGLRQGGNRLNIVLGGGWKQLVSDNGCREWWIKTNTTNGKQSGITYLIIYSRLYVAQLEKQKQENNSTVVQQKLYRNVPEVE